MKSQSELIKERLKNLMITDRMSGIENLITIIKSDIYNVLLSYMYIAPENININIETSDSGIFTLNLKAQTDHLIYPGKMVE